MFEVSYYHNGKHVKLFSDLQSALQYQNFIFGTKKVDTLLRYV